MLAHRLRRWANINPTLGQSVVFDGYLLPWHHVWRTVHRHPLTRYSTPVLFIHAVFSHFFPFRNVNQGFATLKFRSIYHVHYWTWWPVPTSQNNTDYNKTYFFTYIHAAGCTLHSAISECHSHPLRFCVALTHIQHHGSLSSVTSPSANQQPAVHKWATSGEVDRDWPVVFRCTPAHPLPTHGNLCAQCSSYKPEGIHECSTFYFIFIDN